MLPWSEPLCSPKSYGWQGNGPEEAGNHFQHTLLQCCVPYGNNNVAWHHTLLLPYHDWVFYNKYIFPRITVESRILHSCH